MRTLDDPFRVRGVEEDALWVNFKCRQDFCDTRVIVEMNKDGEISMSTKRVLYAAGISRPQILLTTLLCRPRKSYELTNFRNMAV